MSLETAVFVTTFVFLGAHLVLSGRLGGNQPSPERKREHADKIVELVRPTLLFSNTVPVAMC
jgi:hypothetical protein